MRFVVLDEADQMLNVGFEKDVETILNNVPAERQTMLFSGEQPQGAAALGHGPVCVWLTSVKPCAACLRRTALARAPLRAMASSCSCPLTLYCPSASLSAPAATTPKWVKKLVKTYLNDPVTVDLVGEGNSGKIAESITVLAVQVRMGIRSRCCYCWPARRMPPAGSLHVSLLRFS